MALTKVSRGLLSTGIVDNSNATAITIDSSENVGIGVTPASTVVLDIKEADASTDLILGLTAGTGGRVQIRSVAQSDSTSSALSFHVKTGGSTSEAARIASDGNVLIGQTANASSSAGTILTGSGVAFHTRDGGVSLVCSRLTDNGDIAQFRKGSTVKGRIGTDGSDIFIGSDDTNLLFFQNGFLPANSVGGTRDNASDLGAASARFKDLYLSGGAYLGGTTSANYLDDYEEGSFTPALNGFTGSYTHQIGQYRKVGGLVTASIHIHISSTGGSGSIIVTGLPFTQTSSNRYGGATTIHCNLWATTTKPDNVLVNTNSTVAAFYRVQGQTGVTTPTLADMGTGNILCVFTYMTSQ